MANLLEALQPLITGEIAKQLAGTVGESETSVSRALGAAFPVILSGLLGRAKDQTALEPIVNLLKADSNDPGILTNAAGILGALRGDSPAIALGGKFLAAVFGNKLPAVAGAVAEMAGVQGKSASSLLGMAAPLVMAALAGQLRKGGIGAAGLATLLGSQRDAILAAVPSVLSGTLGLTAFRGTGGAAGTTAAGGMSRLLWPAGVLLVAFGSLWALLNLAPSAPSAPHVSIPAPTLPAAANLDAARQAAEAAARETAAKAQQAADQAGQAAQAVGDAASHAAANLGAFLKRQLPGGVELNVPERGIESQVIGFIADAAKPVDTTTWFNFDRLVFETGSAALKPESMEQIRNIGAILKAFPQVKFKIGGYTDNTGSADLNRKLSGERATTVMNEIVKLGVAGDRLATEGYGDQHPIGDNATPEGRAQNRRIALRVTQK
jgi:OmpA-OmpF porin, OOP family